MKIQISFKGIEHTPALDERINEKSKKLEKLLEGKTTVKWTCYVKDGHHYAEVVLLGPKFEYHAHAYSENLYKTLDKAVDKLWTQMHKKKDKWKNHIHHKHEPPTVIADDPEAVWANHSDDEDVA